MTSPLMHAQALLAGVDALPAVHAHVYRGPPKGRGIVLVGLGGEGLVGTGIVARRNIDFVRLEARAPSLEEAEGILDGAVAALQTSPRLVAVDGTATDYDPATEIYRVFATADIRRL